MPPPPPPPPPPPALEQEPPAPQLEPEVLCPAPAAALPPPLQLEVLQVAPEGVPVFGVVEFGTLKELPSRTPVEGLGPIEQLEVVQTASAEPAPKSTAASTRHAFEV